MIELTVEQQRVYNRFIIARNKVGLVRIRGVKWIPMSDVIRTVDMAGMNHPLFEMNDDWAEYKEASLAWWAVEPAFRYEERMRMSRGDYEKEDSWKEKKVQKDDILRKIEKT